MGELYQKFSAVLDAWKKMGDLRTELKSKDIYLEGETEETKPCMIVHYNEKRFTMEALTSEENFIWIKPYDNRTRNPYSVKIDSLLRQISKLKPDASVSYEIGGSAGSESPDDIRLYLKIEDFLDKPVTEFESKIVLPEKKEVEFSYDKENSEEEGVVVEVNVPKDFALKLEGNLKKTGKTSPGEAPLFKTEKSYLKVELPQNATLNDFINLTEKNAKFLRKNHIISGVKIETPIKDLKNLQIPPLLRIEFEDGYELNYSSEKGHENLEFRLPEDKIKEASEFFENVKIEWQSDENQDS